jgi:hypothetical protein
MYDPEDSRPRTADLLEDNPRLARGWRPVRSSDVSVLKLEGLIAMAGQDVLDGVRMDHAADLRVQREP